ncbi:MAG: helix-turn-helix domain-containing protein [Anaerolineae bacterium]|nr:helix-turn-helix domain-containing protein [Anaerolineae bacterium]
MDWKEHKARLMKDPEFRAEYEALEPVYQLARILVQKRIERELSQTEMARLMRTKQAVVSRLENVATDPRFSTVQSIADALGTKITLTFLPSTNERSKDLRA